ncbi:hypothetical protein [Streptomyces sp. MNU103]
MATTRNTYPALRAPVARSGSSRSSHSRAWQASHTTSKTIATE